MFNAQLISILNFSVRWPMRSELGDLEDFLIGKTPIPTASIGNCQ
jgi:hypothetical protein